MIKRFSPAAMVLLCLLWFHLVAVPAAAQSDISKTLTNTTGVDNSNPIQVGDTVTTTYELTITYTSDNGPAVTILDTIPAEFDNVAVEDSGACTPVSFLKAGRRGKGRGVKGATKIRCDLDANTDANLVVTFQTRQSPGKGHSIYAPTSCDVLLLNNGAVAVDRSADMIVAGPSAALAVNVDDMIDTDNDGVGDACDSFPDDSTRS